MTPDSPTAVTQIHPAGTNAATELASRRTGMSFQRTRMAADRTLMAVIRTSLSLIGFGFTIFKFFQGLQQTKVLEGSLSPRHFGQTLVWIGIAMLTVGIVYHIAFMRGLRKEREQMKAEGLIHADSHFPVSLTLIVALLLLLGLMAVADVSYDAGPLG